MKQSRFIEILYRYLGYKYNFSISYAAYSGQFRLVIRSGLPLIYPYTGKLLYTNVGYREDILLEKGARAIEELYN